MRSNWASKHTIRMCSDVFVFTDLCQKGHSADSAYWLAFAVKKFSGKFQMDFLLEKCVKATSRAG